jgi:hypothetical protein
VHGGSSAARGQRWQQWRTLVAAALAAATATVAAASGKPPGFCGCAWVMCGAAAGGCTCALPHSSSVDKACVGYPGLAVVHNGWSQQAHAPAAVGGGVLECLLRSWLAGTGMTRREPVCLQAEVHVQVLQHEISVCIACHMQPGCRWRILDVVCQGDVVLCLQWVGCVIRIQKSLSYAHRASLFTSTTTMHIRPSIVQRIGPEKMHNTRACRLSTCILSQTRKRPRRLVSTPPSSLRSSVCLMHL